MQFKIKAPNNFAPDYGWLENNKISGGGIMSNRVPKGSNQLKITLRHSANSLNPVWNFNDSQN